MRGIVLERETVTSHNGTVYERSVEFSLNGDYQTTIRTLTLFDPSLHIDQEMVGDEIPLTLSIYPSTNVEIIEKSNPDIREPRSAISDWSYDFIGEVLSIPPNAQWDVESPNPYFVLDIGVGEVIVRPYRAVLDSLDSGSLEVGDTLRITASRTEIFGVLESY